MRRRTIALLYLLILARRWIVHGFKFIELHCGSSTSETIQCGAFSKFSATPYIRLGGMA